MAWFHGFHPRHRCYVGGLNFLSFRVEPVLTVSVIVGERGPTVKLLETEVQAMPFAEVTLAARWASGTWAGED